MPKKPPKRTPQQRDEEYIHELVHGAHLATCLFSDVQNGLYDALFRRFPAMKKAFVHAEDALGGAYQAAGKVMFELLELNDESAAKHPKKRTPRAGKTAS